MSVGAYALRVPSVSVDAHAGLPFMNPLSERTVERAIAALSLPRGARVLETGCGSAALLIRALERHPQTAGVGVDHDEDALARARRAATVRLAGREPVLIAAAVDDAPLEPASFDLVINVAASQAHGGFPGALGKLAELTAPGGVVLFGEGFWTTAPSQAFLEALGGASIDELPLGIEQLTAAARSAGLRPVAREIASAEDWANYEESLANNAEALGTAEGDAYATVIRRRRALPGGTTTLGFALLTLRR
jgi:SAM-dependent methyltransferase